MLFLLATIWMDFLRLLILFTLIDENTFGIFLWVSNLFCLMLGDTISLSAGLRESNEDLHRVCRFVAFLGSSSTMQSVVIESKQLLMVL
jgi:hypothetical protein